MLKKESVQVLWNPIFNANVERIDKPDWECGVIHYTAKNRLLLSHMENSESWLTSARGLVFLRVCGGMLGASLVLHAFGGEHFYLRVTV